MAMQRSNFHKKQCFEKEKVCDWAELPEDILETILKRLPILDCITLANVCKPWQHILTKIPTLEPRGIPLLIMSRQNSRNIRTCFNLLKKEYLRLGMSEACWWYCWGSFQDWLIMSQYMRDPFPSFIKLMLFNPFSKTKVDLPTVPYSYHKMVLSANPFGKFFICLLLHQYQSKVAFWIPGAQEWHELVIAEQQQSFEDAVFSNQCFYVVTKNYDIVRINTTSINDSSGFSNKVIKVEYYSKVNMVKKTPGMAPVWGYLVEYRGEVLLIFRLYSDSGILRTENFEMYKLDAEMMVWKKLKALSDQIVVLDKGGQSRSFDANELIGISNSKSNCIYFLNDRCSWANEWDIVRDRAELGRPFLEGSDESDWGIFSLDDKEDNAPTFCYNGNVDHWAPICITAPLWWLCSR